MSGCLRMQNRTVGKLGTGNTKMGYLMSQIIAHLRFGGVEIKKVALGEELWEYTIQVSQVFKSIEEKNNKLIKWYKMVFRCTGEKVYANMDNHFYYDFVGIKE